MTDAEFAAQKERIVTLIIRWTPLLGLKWWRTEYCYARSHDEMPDAASQMAAAVCSVLWPYMDVKISWDLSLIADMDDERLEATFVHEWMHAFVREMRDDTGHDDINHEERVCSMLARAFVWTCDGIKSQQDSVGEAGK